MKLENKNKDIILSSLRLIKTCPVCNEKYTSSVAHLVEKTDDGFLIHFSCPVCSTYLIANIVELPFGVVGSAMVTDLQADEVLKFKDSEEVTVDDVLDVYQELEIKNKNINKVSNI